jgi:hypothetical protein
VRAWIAIAVAVLAAGCGSGQVDTARATAAIRAAQQTERYRELGLSFPDRPGQADCTLGQGGPTMQSSPGVQQPPGTVTCRSSAEPGRDGSVLVTFTKGDQSWEFQVSRAGRVSGPSSQ